MSVGNGSGRERVKGERKTHYNYHGTQQKTGHKSSLSAIKGICGRILDYLGRFRSR